jgi:ATP-dependent RNA helicase RhlE
MFNAAIPQHPVETTDTTFTSLGLSPEVVATIEKIGFVHPTPIQAAVIPTALTGRDAIGLAQTGSGKTAAFVLPMAERLTHGRGVRGLIMAPTREIALQTKAFLDLFGKNHNLQTACLIGGVRMKPQLDALHDNPDVVVATPGRLLDHVNRRTVNLEKVEVLVLDEADHMLDLGFLPQIRDVLRRLPRDRQTMMFSATMPDSIEMIARDFMRDPVRIDIMPAGGAAEGITHRVYVVKEADKRNCLLALLDQELGSTLVFTRRKIDAEWLYAVLDRKGHPVARIHADQSQNKRVDALKTFREGEHRILVATDIAGRGIDIPGIEHVINFDIPENVEDYVHRAGRTARGRAKGIVATIATWQDLPMVRKIEETLGEKIPRCTVPGVEAWEESEKKATTKRRRV